MTRFHCFFDDNDQPIVVEDHPDAIDAAPYDRMARRGAIVDCEKAMLALLMFGGTFVGKSGREQTFQAMPAPGE